MRSFRARQVTEIGREPMSALAVELALEAAATSDFA
jgi:hypothetical protein